ncbi:Nucleic-acid-binding protein from transposon X-element [Eumeta japonica]|uniref:Nucleic-acid-binding protein from transposon X-element n=1 Tax=Eumeta variegata TaxID=151549 RepID=A0A4C1ZPJ3_EUMVA|nr:Nucleic-acid-binding protein from transposon X-element [Eumeta japonica]
MDMRPTGVDNHRRPYTSTTSGELQSFRAHTASGIQAEDPHYSRCYCSDSRQAAGSPTVRAFTQTYAAGKYDNHVGPYTSRLTALASSHLSGVTTRWEDYEYSYPLSSKSSTPMRMATAAATNTASRTTGFCEVDYTSVINVASDHLPPKFPPIVAEHLSNWGMHFRKLNQLLGHVPNARHFEKGVWFLAQSNNEYRTVLQYLVAATQQVPAEIWFCFATTSKEQANVSVRGLPAGTHTKDIKQELCNLGFPVECVRFVSSRRERSGCLFHVRLDHLNQDELQRLYSVKTLLSTPNVAIEKWRERPGPPQCHKCDTFGHTSANCYLPRQCIRCCGPHYAVNCPRLRDDFPTCITCARMHATDDPRCPVYRKKVFRRKHQLAPLLAPMKHDNPPERLAQQQNSPSKKMISPRSPTPPTFCPDRPSNVSSMRSLLVAHLLSSQVPAAEH